MAYPYIDTQFEALEFLSRTKAHNDPAFARSIIRTYCTRKLVRGRSRHETGYKLHLLERELVFRRSPIPNLGSIFIEIREELGLPDSHIFRRVSNPSPSFEFSNPGGFAPVGIAGRRASDGQASIHRPTDHLRSTSAFTSRPSRPPVVRASEHEDRATTPPPAYERMDPNPDSDLAAAIAASLSAEQSSSSSEQRYAPPPGPPPPHVISNTVSGRNAGGQSLEDPLLLLSTYHTYFLVDDSTSMGQGDRWTDMVKAISSVVPLAANFDPEGVELHFVNSIEGKKGVRTEEEVEDIFARVFRPEGHIPMGVKLDVLLRNYLNRLEESEAGLRPLNLIIMTDGASLQPSPALNSNPFLRSDSPESIIAKTARRLDHGNHPLNQLGLFFLQIGDDAEAREFLQDMDDSLPSRHDVRDIVDTLSFSGLTSELNANDGELVRKILLGGVDKRIDREI